METDRGQTIETLLVSVNRLIRTAAQATGNTTSSAVWRTLGILATDQPLRLGELAAASRVAQPTMTRLVAGMVADGLVERSIDPDDSRGQRIELTDSGHARLVDWRATMARAVGPMFADLDADEWDVLHRAAELVAARTGGAATSAPADTRTSTSTSTSTRTEITA